MATAFTSGSGSAPGDAPLGIDIRYYASILWRGRAVLLAAVAVSTLLAVFLALLQTKEYEATAMLQIEPPAPTFITVTDALMGSGNYWQNADFYNTQFKVLRSRSLGATVVERLKLQDRPPFQDHADPGTLFMSHVTIQPIPETRLALVRVWHEDPAEAALWANTLADTYIDQTLAQRVEAARRAVDWLQDRLAATQRAMRDAHDRLLRSYQGQDLVLTGNSGSVSAASTTISRLSDDHIAAQSRRIALEAALKQADQMKTRGGLENLPQVAQDAVVGDLNAQMARLTLEMSRLREKFKDAHPEVQRTQAQIDETQKARLARAEQVVLGLEAELAQVRKRETELQTAIDAQKQEATAQSRAATESEALRKEAESHKSLYELLLQKLNETDLAASLRSNNVTVVERASRPTSPVRPDRRHYAGVGVLAGLIIGVGLVLGRDLLENTVKNPEDVERYLHLDLLAAVPHSDLQRGHQATEAYQSLRTALIFARREDTGQVVLITGTAPQEGKTTTLINIARLLASSGERVVCVDLDLRRAQLNNRLGQAREPGVTDYFVNHASIDTLVRPTDAPNLFLVAAGALPPNPPALLARRATADLLNSLRERFDWVLVDSPPLASVTDSLLIARHTDLIVFVVRHNAVDKRLVRRSVDALRRVSPNILGGLLNAVDISTRPYHYYYYYREYEGLPEAAAPPGPAGKGPA